MRHNRLYNLLPALYRQVDGSTGGSLHALLAVLDEELAKLEDDFEAQYDNWFIETCDRWVLPYIADLVGVAELQDNKQLFSGQRRHVANALRYRRRKGTLATLEDVLHDVTGWPTRAVEFRPQTAMTQHVGQIQAEQGAVVDVRQAARLANLGTAFNEQAHTADLRPIQAADPTQRGGRFNLHNIGIFQWRLYPYPVTRGAAHRRAAPADSEKQVVLYRFDPAGEDSVLFHSPTPRHDRAPQTGREQLPVQLTRTLLASDLAAYREKSPTQRSVNSRFYGPERGLFIRYWFHNGQQYELRDVPPHCVVSQPLEEEKMGLVEGHKLLVALDPERGRFAFIGREQPAPDAAVVVNYTPAFSGPIGGGSYPRQVPLQFTQANLLHIRIAEGARNDPFTWGESVLQARTLQAAVALWDAFCSDAAQRGLKPQGVVQFMDNGVYGGREPDELTGDLVIEVPSGAKLSLVAADGVQPTIRPFTRLVLIGRAGEEQNRASQTQTIRLDGLRICGPVVFKMEGMDDQIDIQIDDCRLLPAGLTIERSAAAARMSLTVRRCLLGPLLLQESIHSLALQDSLLHAPQAEALRVAADQKMEIVLKYLTVFGRVAIPSLTLALDCLFTEPLLIGAQSDKKMDEGGVVQGYTEKNVEIRFCYLAAGSNLSWDEPPVAPLAAVPYFTAIDPYHPAYGQLTATTSQHIWRGSEQGSEIGAFCRFNHPIRAANVPSILDEYLPYGLQAGVFYVT